MRNATPATITSERPSFWGKSLRINRSRQPQDGQVCMTPSPGTPGEGWGEGSFGLESCSAIAEEPSPYPLPEYRERDKSKRQSRRSHQLECDDFTNKHEYTRDVENPRRALRAPPLDAVVGH